MRFGVCAGLGQAPHVMAAGFDYVELAAVAFVEPGFDLTRARDFPVPRTNVFFPGSLRLFEQDWRPHARGVLEVAATLGVEKMVVGSGAARRAPEGMSVEDAELRFLDLIEELQGMAGSIRIVPESLERGETNVFNSLAALANGLADRSLGYTADSYHVLKEWDYEGRPGSPTDLMLREIPICPEHVHLGDLPRNPPDPGDPMVTPFVDRLRDLGYDSTVSLECRWTDFEAQLPLAYSNLKELFSCH